MNGKENEATSRQWVIDCELGVKVWSLAIQMDAVEKIKKSSASQQISRI